MHRQKNICLLDVLKVMFLAWSPGWEGVKYVKLPSSSLKSRKETDKATSPRGIISCSYEGLNKVWLEHESLSALLNTSGKAQEVFALRHGGEERLAR